jgi:hypothetical protein
MARSRVSDLRVLAMCELPLARSSMYISRPVAIVASALFFFGILVLSFF